MKQVFRLLITVGGLVITLVACRGPLVGVTVVDERTALENQVLGSYEELEEEVLLGGLRSVP